MRGQRLFNAIIKDSGLTGSKRKGRNGSLVVKRNECLIARYYYYGYVKNKGYEEILHLLISEFFISPNTIYYLIQDYAAELQTLKQNAPPLYYFQNHWPHLKW
jgi:hypothetical protein